MARFNPLRDMTNAQVQAHCALHTLRSPLAQGEGFADDEALLLRTIRRLASQTGWLCYHTYRSEHSEKGFPDLVLVKPGRVIFAELKNNRRKLTAEQAQWLSLLKQSVPGVEAYLWRPRDGGEIVTCLTRP